MKSRKKKERICFRIKSFQSMSRFYVQQLDKENIIK